MRVQVITHHSSLITHPLSHDLFDNEAGKRRLLNRGNPVIERYNEGRDEAFKIRLSRADVRSSFRYRLKPGHNVYEVETRLGPSYPIVPPKRRILTPLVLCPHLPRRTIALSLAAGQHADSSRWTQPSSPASSPCRPRALAGVLRNLARDQRMGRCLKRNDG